MKLKNIYSIVANPKWNYYALLLTALLMPFYTRFLPYLVGFSALTWLLQGNYIERFKKVKSSNYALLFLLFYFLHLIGLIYTEQFKSGIFDIQLKLSLLAFPILFFSSVEYLRTRKDQFFNAFVIGNLVASMLCLAFSTYQSYLNRGDGILNISIYENYREWPFFKLFLSGYSFFNYSALSHFIQVSYFSMYLVWAGYFVYYRLSERWKILGHRYKITAILVLVFFLFMILQLQSRASFISLFIILFYEIVNQLKRPGRLFLKLSSLFSFLIVVSVVILLSGRFTNFKEGVTSSSIEKLRKTEMRLVIWERAFPLIGRHPILGVGTGDVQDVILENYNDEFRGISQGQYYNLHNEFFETTLRLGLLGGVLLIILIVLPLFRIKKFEDRQLLVVFVLLIISNFLFESMLNRLNGVVFFSFFYSLLISVGKFPAASGEKK